MVEINEAGLCSFCGVVSEPHNMEDCIQKLRQQNAWLVGLLEKAGRQIAALHKQLDIYDLGGTRIHIIDEEEITAELTARG